MIHFCSYSFIGVTSGQHDEEDPTPVMIPSPSPQMPPVTPVLEPLIISITEIQPQSSAEEAFSGEWTIEPPFTTNTVVDREPVASPTSTTADPVIDSQPLASLTISTNPMNVSDFVVDQQPEPNNLVSAEEVVTSNLWQPQPSPPESFEVEDGENDDGQALGSIHSGEIKDFPIIIEQSVSETNGHVEIKTQSKPTTLLQQAEAAIADLDISQSSRTDDTYVKNQEKASRISNHQVTYDGADDDGDSVIQKIRNQDKRIVEQIRKENESNPTWLRGRSCDFNGIFFIHIY